MPKNNEKYLVFSNVDKIFWPQEGYTKGDVIEYYEQVAPFILPHLKDRPMVLNRHPHGIQGESFYQKNVRKNELPAFVETIRISHSDHDVTYLMVQNIETLFYVVNLAAIELHPFLSRTKSLHKPDFMVLDFDPLNVDFTDVVKVATLAHEILDAMKLKHFLKTSGGRGLHLYLPLAARYTYAQSQAVAKFLGELLLQEMPNLISLERSPKKREGKIYIDYLRNSLGQTAASVYCVRPRPHAPVATPLLWNELISTLNPTDFTIKTVPERLLTLGDIFLEVLADGVDLSKVLRHVK